MHNVMQHQRLAIVNIIVLSLIPSPWVRSANCWTLTENLTHVDSRWGPNWPHGFGCRRVFRGARGYCRGSREPISSICGRNFGAPGSVDWTDARWNVERVRVLRQFPCWLLHLVVWLVSRVVLWDFPVAKTCLRSCISQGAYSTGSFECDT